MLLLYGLLSLKLVGIELLLAAAAADVVVDDPDFKIETMLLTGKP